MHCCLDIFSCLEALSGLISALALLTSVVAMIVAICTLRMKLGNKVEGDYQVIETWETELPYVSELFLHNLKDKTLNIRNIYLRFGHNIYIDLLDNEFQKDTIYTLEPLGSLYFKLGPVTSYIDNLKSVNVNNYLKGKKEGTLVLSTNEGMIDVKNVNLYIHPYRRSLLNWKTAVIQAVRYQMDDIKDSKIINIDSFGDNLLYLLTLKIEGREEQYPIYAFKAIESGYLQGLHVTNADLETKESLKKFLLKAKKEQRVKFDSIKIEDKREHVKRFKQRFEKDSSSSVRQYNWFSYYIVGRFQTEWYERTAEWHNNRKNKKN